MVARVGVVIHPSRAVERPLQALRDWAAQRSIELVQVPAGFRQPMVADPGDAGDCDLIVSIGGDGTMLAALRAAAVAGRPVLGIACGSLGVLTAIPAGTIADALDRFQAGDWVGHRLPALDIARARGERLFALNDLAIVRTGQGQIGVRVMVDGALFVDFVGDGCIVSTPSGSSAYGLAAGGPLLTADTDAFVVTPLTAHGGSCPPLVVASSAEVRLMVGTRYGGGRLEVDGQLAEMEIEPLTITYRAAAATVIGFGDQEPLLTRLRRRQVIIDSPRILAEMARREQPDDSG
jgi:NAD+ kinase